MIKKIIDILFILLLVIVSYISGYYRAENKYKSEINTCKGMNSMYLDEYQNLIENCGN